MCVCMCVCVKQTPFSFVEAAAARPRITVVGWSAWHQCLWRFGHHFGQHQHTHTHKCTHTHLWGLPHQHQHKDAWRAQQGGRCILLLPCPTCGVAGSFERHQEGLPGGRRVAWGASTRVSLAQACGRVCVCVCVCARVCVC